MGLFGSSSSYNPIEQALLEEYTTLMKTTGTGKSEARKMAEEMLKQAIEKSKDEGSYYLPLNFGDVILGNAVTDDPAIKGFAEMIRKNIPKKKAEGVRDEDIRWWWNLYDIERHMMQQQDNLINLAHFTHALQDPMEPSKSLNESFANAATRVRKLHPKYGDPADTTHTTGDDRPLPFELKDRINSYILKRMQTDPEKFKKEMEQSSTFNALVRKEIRAGNL